MAKKEDRKKQKKREKERNKAKAHAKYLAEKAKAEWYPDIAVLTDCKNPAFRKAITEILSGFSYTDDTHCPPEIRKQYAKIALIGWTEWYDATRLRMRETSPDENAAQQKLQRATLPVFLHLGTWIFERLPPRYTTTFDPEHFFFVDRYRNQMMVSFTLMDSIEDKGQRLYVPHWKPAVQMQGATWKVGLYPHALEQLCARLVPQGSLSYSNCLDVFVRFQQRLLRFTPASLADGQEAVRVDFRPPLGTVFYENYAAWVRKVLDLPDTHDFADDRWHAIVLGYLPLHIQGKYARAKTFLLPGFKKTPEFVLGLKRAATGPMRQLLMAMTDEKRRTFDLTGDTISAIKWYHESGVPQVYTL